MNGQNSGIRFLRRRAVVLLLLAMSAYAFADVTVTVADPIISSPDRNFGQYLQPQLTQAYSGAADTLAGITGEAFQFSRAGRGAGLSMSVIVTDSPQYSALIIQMTNLQTGAVAQPFNYTAGWGPNLHRTLSRAIVYLYLSVTDPPKPAAPPPVLLSEIATARISTRELGVDLDVAPYGLATDSHGDLLVASPGTVVRFDRYFREIGKLRAPDQASQFAWSGNVAVSPSDMVYVQALTGGDLWEFSPEIPEARRVRTGGQSTASIAVLEDGSLVLHGQMDQNTVRFRDGQRQDLALTKGQYSFVRALSGGPDNTLWIWDLTSGLASISDPNGFEIDVVIPVIDSTERAYISAIRPYPNGDLLLGSQNALYRVDKNGIPVWSFSFVDNPNIGTLLGMSSIAFDGANGLIYVNDPLQGRIFQILDVDYAQAAGGLDGPMAELLDIAQRLDRSPEDAEAHARRAELYEQMEAWTPAHHNWDLASYLAPSEQQYAAGVERVDFAQQLEVARLIAAQAREVLRTIGRASAQTDYFNSLAVYEQLMAKDPGNNQVAEEMDQLIREFEQPMGPRQRNPRPLTIVSVDIEDVFPSLSLYYRSHPIGSVVLRNDQDVGLTDIVVQLEMSVMDFPVRSQSLEGLAPGESLEVPLFIRLGERVLAQRGRLLVQPRITVEYVADGKDLSVSEVTEVFVHSNTAITWDDSRKLAAFIMPDERIASDFGSRYATVEGEAERIDLSDRFFRAVRLADVVGSLGISYVEDPLLGISQIFGEANVVDSVRYPRDTLRVEAGDCDDTTALLCTLYEATGIATAIMTSPGHVFMAFDTGEPVQNRWMFESDVTAAIEHGSTIWLPVETTILEKGFNAAWQEGSRLWNRYQPTGQIEFLPVSDARSMYEPIPTGDVAFDLRDLDDPVAAGADDLFGQSVTGIVDRLYGGSVRVLERAMTSQSDRQKLRTLNQLGVLHARFNEHREAERSFNTAISLDADYTTSYINLANLRIITGDPQAAIALLGEVTDRRPGSVLANLLLAQANQMLGNRGAAEGYMVRVQEQAPELASQYPHLSGAGVGRASEAQASPVLPWPVDEE